jgi:hypothetical protein
MASIGEVRGFAPPSRAQFDHDANRDGALFVGDPEEIAERIVALHKKLGHMRQFFQMDVGHLPQKEFLHAIELLGTKVKPLVDAELRVTDSHQEAVNMRQSDPHRWHSRSHARGYGRRTGGRQVQTIPRPRRQQ